MAIPTFPTFVSGNVLTAAQQNQLVTASRFPATGPKASISRTTGQSVASPGAFITFTNVDYDDNNLADLTANNDRLTVRTAGTYQISGQAAWLETSTGGNYKVAELWVSGSRVAGQTYRGAGFNGAEFSLNVFRKRALIVGDYVQLKLVHDAGTALTTVASYGGNFLQLSWDGE